METVKPKSMQTQFFQKIEDIIPANCSLVNELSDLLGISMDSSYRRLRGETLLTIDEIIILCNRYNISFDSFSNIDSNNVTFRYSSMNEGEKSFQNYMQSLLDDLKVIYACPDIPIFYNYNYPEVANFKMFYWMKSIMNLPELEGEKFHPSKISDKLKDLGKQIFETYAPIPSTEIWTDSTVHNFIKQIKYYWGSGMFEKGSDAIDICLQLKNELSFIRKQAELGKKFVSEEKTNEYKDNYKMYLSEIEIANNCILVSLGETKAVYLSHLTFNVLSTSNVAYCDETEIWINNLIKRSVLISGVSEKHRYQFFNKSFKIVDDLIAIIKEG